MTTERVFEKVDNFTLKEIEIETNQKENTLDLSYIKERLNYFKENENTIVTLYNNDVANALRSKNERLVSNAELIALWQKRLDEATKLGVKERTEPISVDNLEPIQ